MTIRDNVLRVRENINTDVPSQFPAIYREDAPLFVEFIKAYYEHLDAQATKFRDAFYFRSVDTTDYDRFLLFFKNKYLADMPFDASTDLRFVIKHITDFYRRKGTEESLRLLFRMFFDEEIEIYYPSSAMLKPSDSVYGSNIYLEMRPIHSRDVDSYPIKKGGKLRGDTSKAEAFVDDVLFKNFRGSITPIIFISSTIGNFIADDGIEYADGSGISYIGKLIQGSISSLVVNTSGRLPGNKVGDEVKLISDLYGLSAKGIVKSISETTTGVIEFKVQDSGYGYTTDDSAYPSTYEISNQVLVVPSASTVTLNRGDTVSATNAVLRYISNNAVVPNYTTITASAQVLKYDSSSSIIYLLTTENDAFPEIPTGTYFVAQDDVDGVDFTVVSSSAYKVDAQWRIGAIKNTETLKLIPDIIGDYLNVQLDSTNYGMSGSGQETLATPINQAFTPITLTIGEIDKIKILDSGTGFRNDVLSYVQQNEIVNFDKRDVGLVFDRVDFLLQTGDYITQVIQIEDLSNFSSSTTTYINYTVKLQFLRRDGDTFYFRPKSFYALDEDLPVVIKNDSYNIVKIVEDKLSLPMGGNGIISGQAFFAEGQINVVQVTETGYKYRDGEEVRIVNNSLSSNNYGLDVATGVIEVRGNGYTEGKWLTTTSMLNDSTKVIQDSYYYQEYSYDISSIINPDKYTTLVKNEVSVAGTKMFGSPLINSFNTFETDVDMRLEIYTLDEELNVQENSVIQGPLYAQLGGLPQQELVATIANLVEDETNRVNQQINS